MKIAINAAWMQPGKAGGMEWYARNLIQQMGEVDSKNDYLLVTSDLNDEIFSDEMPSHWQRYVHNGHDVSPAWYRKAPAVSSSTSLPRVLRRSGVDVLFCPFMYSLPEETDIPTVITIPDLQHEHLPNMFHPYELGSRVLGYRRSMERAATVLAISEAVRNDILTVYAELDPTKVVATPLGLNDDCRNVDAAEARRLGLATAVRHRLNFPFFYYPANSWPHKNHQQLLTAFKSAIEQGCKTHLVLSGSVEGFQSNFGQMVDELGLKSWVHHVGYVSRSEVFGLYNRAEALVFPSRFEGFGLPILEAMHLGTPVVCSDIAPLREVGGDHATYFDPDDSEAIANALLVSARRENAETTSATSAGHAAKFTYANTAKRTIAALEDAHRQSARDQKALRSDPHCEQIQTFELALRSPIGISFRCRCAAEQPLAEPVSGRSVAASIDGHVLIHQDLPCSGEHQSRGEISGAAEPIPRLRTLAVGAFADGGGPRPDLVIDELVVEDAHYGSIQVI